MKVQFDTRGNLTPYELVETDFSTFQKHFVLPFSQNSSRHFIFHQFRLFLEELKKLIPEPLECWLDGSFVTTLANPKYLDVVVFIDFQYFNTNRELLSQFFRSFGSSPEKLIDAYPVVVYPENHRNFTFYRSDYLYWLHLYGRTKPNRGQRQFPKGIIKIFS